MKFTKPLPSPSRSPNILLSFHSPLSSSIESLSFHLFLPFFFLIKTDSRVALAHVAQLVGALSYVDGKVSGVTPGQGTYLGCEFGPWSGHIQESTS